MLASMPALMIAWLFVENSWPPESRTTIGRVVPVPNSSSAGEALSRSSTSRVSRVPGGNRDWR